MSEACKGVCFRGYEAVKTHFSGPVNTYPAVCIVPLDAKDASEYIWKPTDRQKLDGAAIVKEMVQLCPGVSDDGTCGAWKAVELGQRGDIGPDVYFVIDPSIKVRGEE